MVGWQQKREWCCTYPPVLSAYCVFCVKQTHSLCWKPPRTRNSLGCCGRAESFNTEFRVGWQQKESVNAHPPVQSVHTVLHTNPHVMETDCELTLSESARPPYIRKRKISYVPLPMGARPVRVNTILTLQTAHKHHCELIHPTPTFIACIQGEWPSEYCHTHCGHLDASPTVGIGWLSGLWKWKKKMRKYFLCSFSCWTRNSMAHTPLSPLVLEISACVSGFNSFLSAFWCFPRGRVTG